MNVIPTLIIPVCIGNRMSAHSRGGGKCYYAHCTHGSDVFKSPRRGFEARQLMKFIQASVTVNSGSPGSGPHPCASRKRTSSSCSIVYPAIILTILCPNRYELTKDHLCNSTNLSANVVGLKETPSAARVSQGVSLREIPNMRSGRGGPLEAWRGEILFLPIKIFNTNIY